jgi:hypothetical protein
LTAETIEEKLKKDGWEKMFTAKEPRLSECVELYESMGLEVHLEPLLLEEFEAECKSCYAEDIEQYRTIYTRKGGKNE